MKTIRWFFWGYLVVLAGLWWASDGTTWAKLSGVFAWRSVLMQASGVLAIGAMSAAMVLAARPSRLEPWFGGLDKMYRVHKWMGIAALVCSVAHWLLAQGPKWLVGWGLLERPTRGPRPDLSGEPVRAFLMSQRGLAETLGEWAFYAAVVLIVLALLRRFPYRWFVGTHRWIAAAYLVLAWHTIVLLEFAYWARPVGWVVALLLAAGGVAAVMALLARIGARRRVTGEVASVRPYPALGVVEVDIALHGRWPGHEAGQFAFLTLHEEEGPHPFTISSAWNGDGRMTFIIKGLGDYTRTLSDTVKVRDPVQVEGPYGRFNFDSPPRRQIWVGAGIGITPFISRMKALAREPDGRTIDLFHPTAVYDEPGIVQLQADADAAGVRLHVIWDQRDGRLDAARIAAMVPEWREADIWFCGPAAFGRALRQDFKAMGLADERFHQELFEMR